MNSEEIKTYLNIRYNFDNKFASLINRVVEYYKKYYKEYYSPITKYELCLIKPFSLEEARIIIHLEYDIDCFESFEISIDSLCQLDLEKEISNLIGEEEQKKKLEYEEGERIKQEKKKLEIEKKEKTEYERLKAKFEK